ncbi:Tubulin monoglutamylase TTLL4 [Anthophora plagiata]
MQGDFGHPVLRKSQETSNRSATTSTSNGMINLNGDSDEEWLAYTKLTELVLSRPKSHLLARYRPTIWRNYLARSADTCRRPTKLTKIKSIELEKTIESEKYHNIIFDKRADGDKVRNIAPVPMRRSLFPHVPPYVLFRSHDHAPTKKVPKDFAQLLKWKFTTSMPRLLVKILINTGYQVIEKGNEWSGVWNLSTKDTSRYKRMKCYQKINSMPGSNNIGNKDQLWQHLSRMARKYGSKEYGLMPKTYVLPHEIKKFESMWYKNGIGTTWIIKPPAAGRGQGIKIVNQWWEIPKWHSMVIQRYITRPKLINGLKFDLRVYVLLTSINPLKIYIYKEGLVRFASVRYVRGANLSDKYMHLTNSSVNKQNPAYVANDAVNSFKGHKWSFSSLWSYLRQEEVNVAELWAKIKDIVIKTFVAAELDMNATVSEYLVSRYTCYELYGFDILLDESLRPWLLEVNVLPSLQADSPLDTAIKGPLIKNVLNISGYQIPKMEHISDNCAYTKKYDSIGHDYRLYNTALSLDEKTKQNDINAMQSREEYIDTILKKLTRDDLRQLIRYEDEISQTGNFEKVFPTKHSFLYFKFFQVERYYDRLLDAWEHQYSDNRLEGIRRLQRHCETMQHLDLSPG